MNFFKIIILITLIIFSSRAFADTQEENSELLEQVKEITKELENEKKPEVDTNRVVLDEDEVPLNDPFAGNEGQSSSTINPETGEERDELSLYNFKLTGLISGKDESYISLTNISGDVITLKLNQNLGEIKFVDLRWSEAIFEKEDKSFIIIDFNNQIREADEY